MIVDRRDELTRQRVQTLNRLQRLLAELIPGTSKKDITVLQAKAKIASVRPRDLVGKTQRRIAADELTDLVAVEKKIKTLTKDLKTIVEASGSSLTTLAGVGTIVAARVLAEVGDVTGSPIGTGSRPGLELLRWRLLRVSRFATGSRARATGG